MWNLNKCRDSQNFKFNGYQKIKSSCTESAVLLSCASYTTVYDAALHNVTVPTWWMALTHPTRTLNKCHANTRYSTLSYIFTTMMSRYAIHHSSETVNLYVHASLKQHKWLKCFLVLFKGRGRTTASFQLWMPIDFYSAYSSAEVMLEAMWGNHSATAKLKVYI